MIVASSQQRVETMLHQRCRVAVILTLLCLAMGMGQVQAAAPAWVEPRALNIVDIAGQVPDSVLADNILVYGSAGIMQFMSSERQGATLRTRTRSYARRADGADSGSRWRPYWDNVPCSITWAA